jgi:3-deoxy-7-phosphoheptulonate synthase
MLIVMQKDATTAQHDGVQEAIRSLGFEAIPVPGPSRMAICVVGNDGPVSEAPFVGLGGIAELIRVSQPYKLVSREVHPENTVISVGNAQIGAARPVLMAGPCSVETESRTLEIARQVAAKGAEIFRAGAYKPRTSPYSFQGLGEEGLHTLKCVRDETGLAVVTEVIDPESVDIVASYVDILQIGARNMQNFSLITKNGLWLLSTSSPKETKTSSSANGAFAPSPPTLATPSTSMSCRLCNRSVTCPS